MMGLVPFQENNKRELALSSTMCRYNKEVAVCKPRSETSPDSGSVGTLILDFPDSITEK